MAGSTLLFLLFLQNREIYRVKFSPHKRNIIQSLQKFTERPRMCGQSYRWLSFQKSAKMSHKAPNFSKGQKEKGKRWETEVFPFWDTFLFFLGVRLKIKKGHEKAQRVNGGKKGRQRKRTSMSNLGGGDYGVHFCRKRMSPQCLSHSLIPVYLKWQVSIASGRLICMKSIKFCVEACGKFTLGWGICSSLQLAFGEFSMELRFHWQNGDWWSRQSFV